MKNCHIPYLIQVSPPAVEPLTLSETKLYLRVTATDEDAFIAGLITVAREAAENFIKRSLITQSWMLSYDDYAPSEVLLLRGPVQSITHVKLIARDATETTVDSLTYYLNAGGEKLIFDANPVSNIVEITYTAGFGDSASDVPKDIKQGMLAHIADLYNERSKFASLGEASIALYAPYRILRV